jgi:hypothetical protein
MISLSTCSLLLSAVGRSVTKKVMGGNDHGKSKSASSSSSGLDAALSAITGPAKLNTV